MEIRDRTKQENVDEVEHGVDEVTFVGYLRVGGWVAALLVLIYLLGLTIGTSLFSFLYLKLNSENWQTAIACTLGVAILIYVGFGLAFKTYLYKGLLFG